MTAADEPQDVESLRRELSLVRGQRDAAWAQIEAMRRSLSWRLTWPLRRLRWSGRR